MKTALRPEYRRRRRRIRIGIALMTLGAAIAAVHLGWHVAASPPGIVDIVAGYPAGAVIFIIGAIIAGQ